MIPRTEQSWWTDEMREAAAMLDEWDRQEAATEQAEAEAQFMIDAGEHEAQGWAEDVGLQTERLRNEIGRDLTADESDSLLEAVRRSADRGEPYDASLAYWNHWQDLGSVPPDPSNAEDRVGLFAQHVEDIAPQDDPVWSGPEKLDFNDREQRAQGFARLVQFHEANPTAEDEPFEEPNAYEPDLNERIDYGEAA